MDLHNGLFFNLMLEKVHEKISVISVYDCQKGTVFPIKIKWRGRDYHLDKLGFHYKTRVGRTLLHIFSVSTDSTAFKISLDTDTLHWTLEEVYDESAS